MTNNYIMGSIYIFLLFFFFFLGLFIGKRAPSKWKITGFTGLFILFSSVIIQAFFSEYEIDLITWPDYVFFQNWYFFGALIVFGLGITKVKKRNSRALFLFVLFLIILISGVWWNKLYNMDFKFHERGVVQGVTMQSTGYTCAPACCATLLNHHGFKANEKEMAKLCLTLRGGGTYDIESVRGLRLKLAETDYRVRIAKFTWNEFLKLPKPCLVAMDYKHLTHMIVVFGVKEGSVEIGDPLAGREKLSEDYFKEKWLKRAIWVEKKR